MNSSTACSGGRGAGRPRASAAARRRRGRRRRRPAAWRAPRSPRRRGHRRAVARVFGAARAPGRRRSARRSGGSVVARMRGASAADVEERHVGAREAAAGRARWRRRSRSSSTPTRWAAAPAPAPRRSGRACPSIMRTLEARPARRAPRSPAPGTGRDARRGCGRERVGDHHAVEADHRHAARADARRRGWRAPRGSWPGRAWRSPRGSRSRR